MIRRLPTSEHEDSNLVVVMRSTPVAGRPADAAADDARAPLQAGSGEGVIAPSNRVPNLPKPTVPRAQPSSAAVQLSSKWGRELTVLVLAVDVLCGGTDNEVTRSRGGPFPFFVSFSLLPLFSPSLFFFSLFSFLLSSFLVSLFPGFLVFLFLLFSFFIVFLPFFFSHFFIFSFHFSMSFLFFLFPFSANSLRCSWCFSPPLMKLHDFVTEPFNLVHIFRDAHTVPSV